MILCGYHCSRSILFSTSLMLLSIKKIIFPSHHMICEYFLAHSLLFTMRADSAKWMFISWEIDCSSPLEFRSKKNLASLNSVYFGFLNFVWDLLMKPWWVICCRGRFNGEDRNMWNVMMVSHGIIWYSLPRLSIFLTSRIFFCFSKHDTSSSIQTLNESRDAKVFYMIAQKSKKKKLKILLSTVNKKIMSRKLRWKVKWFFLESRLKSRRFTKLFISGNKTYSFWSTRIKIAMWRNSYIFAIIILFLVSRKIIGE